MKKDTFSKKQVIKYQIPKKYSLYTDQHANTLYLVDNNKNIQYYNEVEDVWLNVKFIFGLPLSFLFISSL